MIRELKSFEDDEGYEFFIITPNNSIEDVLIHLISEIDDDPAEGFEHLEDCLRVLKNDIFPPDLFDPESN